MHSFVKFLIWGNDTIKQMPHCIVATENEIPDNYALIKKSPADNSASDLFKEINTY